MTPQNKIKVQQRLKQMQQVRAKGKQPKAIVEPKGALRPFRKSGPSQKAPAKG